MQIVHSVLHSPPIITEEVFCQVCARVCRCVLCILCVRVMLCAGASVSCLHLVLPVDLIRRLAFFSTVCVSVCSSVCASVGVV